MNEDRFKFRAWDKIEKKMWTPILNTEGIPCVIHPISRILLRMDGELLDPIMQCTGLKDCKGNLIYEGDIVFKNSRDITGVVEYFDSHGFMILSMDKKRMSNIKSGRMLKIIGNIHEEATNE